MTASVKSSVDSGPLIRQDPGACLKHRFVRGIGPGRQRRVGGQPRAVGEDVAAHVADRGQPGRCPMHSVGCRDREDAEVLWLPNGADEDEDSALEPRPCESSLETLGELGLADAGKAGHVHRDASLQADSDQLDEVPELHVGG